MRSTPKTRNRMPALALVGVLAALGIGSVAIPTVAAAAAPAGQADGNERPSEWAPAGDLASSGKAPSLTNQVGMPESGSNSELWLGYGLMGAGLLALGCGLAARATTPFGGARSPRSPAGNSSAAHAPAAARVRP